MKLLLAIAILYQLAVEVVCAVFGLVMVRRTWPFRYRLLVFNCCFTAVDELLSFILKFYNYWDPTIYNIGVSIETIIIVYILFCETTLRWSRRLLRVLLIVLPPGSVAAFMLAPAGLAGFSFYSEMLQLLVLVIASCTILIDILQDMSGESLYTRPGFWFSLAILVSSSVFFLLEAIVQYMSYHPATAPFFMPFGVVANTFMYGGIIKCFMVLKKRGTCL